MAPEAEDPLCGLSAAPTLLPRTLGAAAAAAAAAASSPSEADEKAFQDLFDAMALKGSAELLEQAILTVKGHGNIQNLYPNDGGKAIVANAKTQHHGRRPALGRKRAQFSLKSTSSPSVQNVDFSAIEDIEDPDEYFLAFERLENADKELKKLRDEDPTEIAQVHQSKNTRRSRPGILGRKSSYNYHLPVSDDMTNAVGASASQRGTPLKTLVAEEATDNLHAEKVEQLGASKCSKLNSELLVSAEREDSVAEKEKKVNNILDDLLSSFKDLDEGEEEKLLRESLQLKQINIGKIHLPELNSNPADNSRLTGSVALRNNLLGGLIRERTTSRSPMAAISTLKRRISLGDAFKDPYTELPDDNESGRSPNIGQDEQSPILTHDGVGFIAGTGFAAMVVNDKRSSLNERSLEHVLEPGSVLTGKKKTGNSPRSPDVIPDFINSEVINEQHEYTVHNSLLEKEGGLPLDSPVIDKSNYETKDHSSCSVRPSSTKALASPPSRNVVPDHRCSANTATSLHASDGSQEKVAVISQTVVEGEGTSQDNSSQPSIAPQAEVQSENLPIMPDGNAEVQLVETSTAVPLRAGKKPKAAQRKHKRQDLNRRKSLADAGLMWQSGVRRSTRVKSRPLQHWLGERFVYGRIHDSLATVIGIKSYSPAKDGKEPVLKVKSLVSDKYADLVAQAGRY